MREVKALVTILLDESCEMSDSTVRDLLRNDLRAYVGNPTRVMELNTDANPSVEIRCSLCSPVDSFTGAESRKTR